MGGEGWLHQVPGFAVFFQAHFLGAVGIKTQHGGGHAGADGEDVPEVERDDVGHEEIDVLGGIDGAAFADGVGGAGFVGVGAEGVSGLDLGRARADWGCPGLGKRAWAGGSGAWAEGGRGF